MPYVLGSLVTKYGGKRQICIMAPGTAANVAAPTLATDGIAVFSSPKFVPTEEALCPPGYGAGHCTLLIKGTATGGALAGTFTLWGYDAASTCWYELPVNGGTPITPVALAETDTDKITFTQLFSVLNNHVTHFDRLALQLAGIAGTTPAFEAWLVVDGEDS